MLNYCTVEDLKSVVKAPGLDGTIQRYRDGVTVDFNNYIRRNLEYATGLSMLFDVPETFAGASFNFWLDKRNIDLTQAFTVQYSRERCWTDTTTILDPACYVLDADKGKVTLYGPMYGGANRIKISYAGGYAADLTDTDRMTCPVNLRTAAISEGKFRLNSMLNSQEGQQTTQQRRVAVYATQKQVAGLLATSAGVLNEYKKPLGR